MSEQADKALAWLKEVVNQAFTEAQNGDTGMLNRLGFYPGTQYYINNVHGKPEAVMTQWRQWYPQHIREVERLYDGYLREQEAAANTTRIASLEEKLTELLNQVKALTEVAKPEEPPAKKRGRPRKVAEAEAEAEPEDETAEDEAEDTAEQGQEKPEEASADQAEEPEDAES